jgi:hypothetical protein
MDFTGDAYLDTLDRCNLPDIYLILRDGEQFAARKTTMADILEERYAK